MTEGGNHCKQIILGICTWTLKDWNFVIGSITWTELTRRVKFVTSITTEESATVIWGELNKIWNEIKMSPYPIISALCPCGIQTLEESQTKWVIIDWVKIKAENAFLQNSLPIKGFHYGGFFSEHQAAKVTIGGWTMSHMNHRKCAIWRYAQKMPYMIFQPNGIRKLYQNMSQKP